jgi:hypothetical protein
MKKQKIVKQKRETLLPKTEEDLSVTREEAVHIMQSLSLGTENFLKTAYTHGIPDEVTSIILKRFKDALIQPSFPEQDDVSIARLLSTITEKENEWVKKWKLKMIWNDFFYHVGDFIRSKKLMDYTMLKKRYNRSKYYEVGKDTDFFMKDHRKWERRIRKKLAYTVGTIVTIISVITFIQFLKLINFI